MVWLVAAVLLGTLLALAVLFFVSRKVWRAGVLHGKDQATEIFDSAMTLLAKRVDDRRAAANAPQEFQEQATKEVVEWAESVVGHWRRLKENPYLKR